MWVCLNDAFFSIVAHRYQPDQLIVRARRAGDLERYFPEAMVQAGGGTDYAFRTVLSRTVVSDCLARESASIRYDNFKGSVENELLHDAYLKFWGVMRRLQDAAGD